jgi:hypothetical protein
MDALSGSIQPSFFAGGNLRSFGLALLDAAAFFLGFLVAMRSCLLLPQNDNQTQANFLVPSHCGGGGEVGEGVVS